MKKLIALLLLFIGITIAARMLLPPDKTPKAIRATDMPQWHDISQPSHDVPDYDKKTESF